MRYHSLDYIFSLPLDEALSLIDFVYKRQEEELLYQRWIHDLQFQMSFDEFKHRLKPKLKSDEEILAEVKQILTLFERRENNDGNI